MEKEPQWRPNPGKSEKPKDQNRMVHIRFMNGRVHDGPTRAGNWNWKHRGFDFDIKDWAL